MGVQVHKVSYALGAQIAGIDIRKPLDGKHWFPVYTYADDTLQFRTGPQRIRLRIAYSNYKKFGAESTLIVK